MDRMANWGEGWIPACAEMGGGSWRLGAAVALVLGECGQKLGVAGYEILHFAALRSE